MATSGRNLGAEPAQGMLDAQQTPLFDATFVVVDLETTGGSPADAGITEFGAVKVRGGEVLGEFATLVNPGVPIPPLIAALTGITDLAVAAAPGVASATAAFLEFSAGCVLVAHNAPYDIGYLRGACVRHGLSWPSPAVVDTVRLARATLLRDEVPNYKLATLARLAGSAVAPNHRALTDARATVDVLHHLIGRLGDLGVWTLEELLALTSRVSAQQRRKRTLADGLPNSPGVYQFLDRTGRPLYIGTSRRIRDRVRTYFTATEKRTRMAEMVALAEQVTAIECATALEAAVRETRLLAAHKPPYNRHGRAPEREAWLKLTVEPFPRLSIVGAPLADGADYLGPFANRRLAEDVASALRLAFPLRSCSQRLPRSPRGTACLAADLGHCLAPCDGRISVPQYAEMIAEVRACWGAGFGPTGQRLLARAAQFADRQAYERAAQWRDAAAALAAGISASHRHRMLGGCRELIAALPTADHGWEIHIIRHGRLAAAGVAAASVDPRPTLDRLLATAEVVAERPAQAPAASLTEVGHIQRWLEQPGVRIVACDPPLAMPVTAAHRFAADLPPVYGANRAATSRHWSSFLAAEPSAITSLARR